MPNLTPLPADTLLMVRPVAFEYNTQTAANNVFQKKGQENDVPALARAESDAYIRLLEQNGIRVIAVEDTKEPHTPDSVFPNNWFSTHEDGTLVLYPMFSENRRAERKPAVLEAIQKNFKPKRTLDLTHYEENGLFLEGTGSMVLDRVNKIAYACRSPRTSEIVFEDFCNRLGYSGVLFDAADDHDIPIYHTNVMMHMGRDFVTVCMDAVWKPAQREALRQLFAGTGKDIIDISFEQLRCYAGNMMDVRNEKGEICLLLSQTAYNSLREDQIAYFSSKMHLLVPDVQCIEQNGGGSARCMVAEIY